MRRLGDLDSKYSVAARPYCNGRATAFDIVLNRMPADAYTGAQKNLARGKASVVGF
jgi:hypothetical protein